MDAFIICLSGDHNLCPTAQGTIVGRHGGFAERRRARCFAVASRSSHRSLSTICRPPPVWASSE